MNWKIFPSNALKEPLVRDWQRLATNDQAQLTSWQSAFGELLKWWAIPCGKSNGILVLDADVKGGGLETLKQLNIPKTLFQRTQNGGLHYLFKYPTTGHFGNKVKFMPGLDMRGEGGYICHYGIEGSEIAEAPQWLLDAAYGAKKSEALPAITGPTIGIAPEIAHGILSESLNRIRTAPAGESNNTLNTEAFRLGQLVASRAFDRVFVEEELFKAAKDRGKPDYEARATIKSGLDGGAKNPISSPFGEPIPLIHIPEVPIPERWTPKAFTKYDLMNTSKLKKPQLFQDWSSEDIAITSADGGTGKTTLKLYEAICLALGDPFLGFMCKQKGRTLFITGEDTANKLAAMLGAIVRQMGLFEERPGNEEKIKTIIDSIRIKKDADLCLIQKDRQGFLVPNQDALRKIHEAIEDFRPKMIVFDPIAAFWGSEAALNDMSKAVSKFVSEIVDRSQACVEMINHIGKVSSANKDMSQFAGRGGTGLPSHARIARVMRSIDEAEYRELTGENLNENESALMVNVSKFSDGSPILNKPFLVVRQGYLFRRKNLSPGKQLEAERQTSDMERVFNFVKEQRAIERYPSREVIIAEFMENLDSIPKERVKRAIDLLVYRGHMGEKLKAIDNPNQEVGGKVFIIVDGEGRE